MFEHIGQECPVRKVDRPGYHKIMRPNWGVNLIIPWSGGPLVRGMTMNIVCSPPNYYVDPTHATFLTGLLVII